MWPCACPYLDCVYVVQPVRVRVLLRTSNPRSVESGTFCACGIFEEFPGKVRVSAQLWRSKWTWWIWERASGNCRKERKGTCVSQRPGTGEGEPAIAPTSNVRTWEGQHLFLLANIGRTMFLCPLRRCYRCSECCTMESRTLKAKIFCSDSRILLLKSVRATQ